MLKQALCILLVFTICGPSGAQAEAITIDDIYLLKFDDQTKKLIPNKTLREAFCSPGAQPTNAEGVNALMNGVNTFISDNQSPLREYETHPHSGVFASFQRLKAEVANTNSSAAKLRALINQFGVQIKSPENDFDTLSSYTIAAIAAQHASLQTLQLIESRSVYVSRPGDINVLDYAGVMQSDKIDFIVRTRNIKNINRMHTHLVKVLNDQTRVSKYSQPHLSYVRRALKEAREDINIIKSIARIFPNEVSPYKLQSYLENENVIQQLTRWTQNPVAAICGTSPAAVSSITDQCIASDIEFVLSLRNLANHANSTAFYLKDREVGAAVRSFIGIKGPRCGIRGYYHLIKESNNMVTLYTEGEVFVNSSKPNQQKTRFDEFDILTALDVGEPNFKIEK